MTTPQALRDIYVKLGGSMSAYVTKGLYRGYIAALARDIPGVAGYFGGLEGVFIFKNDSEFNWDSQIH